MNLPQPAGPTSPEADFCRFATHGDVAALDRALALVMPRLAMAAKRLAVRPQDVDDLLQETLLRGIRRASRFDPQYDLAGWLYGILRHVAQEHGPARQRAAPEGATAEWTEPHDLLAAKEVQEAIAVGLASVPARYREALHLRLLEGRGASEIAAATGESVATVRSRLQRGLRMLREVLPVGLGLLVAARLSGAERGPAVGLHRAGTAGRRAGRSVAAAVTLGAMLLVTAAAMLVRRSLEVAPAAGLQREARQPEAVANVRPHVARRSALPPQQESERIRVGGRVELAGGAAGARLRAVRVPDDTLPVSRSVLRDPQTAREDQRLRQLLRSGVEQAVDVGGDGSFVLELAPGRYALDLDDDRRGLLVPALVHVRAGDAAHDLGVLLGYLGRMVYGRVPPGESATWAELFDAAATTSSGRDADLVRDSFDRLQVPIAADGSFVFRAVWPEGDLKVLLGGAERVWGATLGQVDAGERREVCGLEPACRRLDVRLPVETDAINGSLEVRQPFGLVVSRPAAARVVFTGLLEGRLEVRWLRAHGVVQLLLVEPEQSVATMPAAPPLYRGVVEDAAGQPVAGATVTMMTLLGDSGAMVVPTRLETDAAGRFAVAAVDAVRFVVDAGAGRLANAAPPVEGELRLQVPTLREVRGRLHDPPVGEELLEVHVRVGNGEVLTTKRRAVRVDVDGGFVVRDVPAVPVSLQLRAGQRVSEVVQLTATQCELSAPVALTALPVIVGQAVDDQGHVVAGAWVGLRTWDLAGQLVRPARVTSTDAMGRFTVSANGMPGEILGWTADGRMRAVCPVVLGRPVTLQLREVGGIVGRVRGDRLGAGVLSVQLVGPEPLASVPVAGDGRFAVAGVIPGRYQVVLRDDGEPGRVLGGHTADVAAGETSAVQFDVQPPPGTVVIGLEGPLRGGEVVVLCDERGAVTSVVAAVGPMLELSLPAGRYRAALAREDRQLGFCASVSVAAGEHGRGVLSWTEQRWNGVVEALAGVEDAKLLVLSDDADALPQVVVPDPDGRVELCGIDQDRCLLLGVGREATRLRLLFAGRVVGPRVEAAMARLTWRNDVVGADRVCIDAIEGVPIRLWPQVERGEIWSSALVPAGTCRMRFGGLRREVTLQVAETRTLEFDD